jgi:Zn-dependent M28 family amino/carboxypeptidase
MTYGSACPAPAWLARRIGGTILALALVWAAACSSVAPPPTRSQTPVATFEPAAIGSRISAEGLLAHLDVLARIAADNGGTRSAGSPGDGATAEYIASALSDAGYRVSDDPFDTEIYVDPGGSTLELLGANGFAFEDGRDFRPMLYAAHGTAEGPVVALGWDPTATAADGPGCAAVDYADLPADAIVLVRPGDCWRRTTVELAQSAGAAAIVTAVPWSGRDEVRRNTLVRAAGMTIPSLVASRDVGAALAAAAASGSSARLSTAGSTEDRAVRSVVAELPGSEPGRVVMIGAHLDSVIDGPGVNDDGSGVAAVLELARAVAGATPAATIRFAFWAAEEPGLRGSSRYVEGLGPDERAGLAAYLNADMIGSPNGFRGVYDETAAAPGSDAIRDLFVADLDRAGLPWDGVDLEGGSDHLPFTIAGVPTGGLHSGAGEILTAEQAQRYGRTAGLAADPCYHLACDDRSNVDPTLLTELASSLARVVTRLASDA